MHTGLRPAPEMARYDKIHAERSGGPAPATPPAPAATRSARPMGVTRIAQLKERDGSGERLRGGVLHARIG